MRSAGVCVLGLMALTAGAFAGQDTVFRLRALNESVAMMNATDGHTHGTITWTPSDRFVFDDDISVHGRLRVSSFKNARYAAAKLSVSKMANCQAQFSLYNENSDSCTTVESERHNKRVKEPLTGLAYFWCAIMYDNTYRCWGHGAHYGNMGNGLNDGNSNRYLVTQVPITFEQPLTSRRLNPRYRVYPAHFTAYNHAVVRADGTVWCLGYGSYGNNGYGGNSHYYYFVQTKTLNNVTAIWGGGTGTYTTWMALEGDNSLWCWGYNGNGQCGIGSFTSTINQPQQILALSDVKMGDISAGDSTSCSCAVRNDDTIWCWGWNEYGQLANGGTGRRDSPSQVGSSTELYLTDVDYFKWHGGRYSTAMALRKDGTVWTWGYNGHGQTGTGSTSTRKRAFQVIDSSGQPIQDVKDIYPTKGSRYGPMCVTTHAGFVYCWGYNNIGALGQGHNSQRNQAYKVNTVDDVDHLVNGYMWEGSPYYHTVCAVTKTSRDTWCWGGNVDGQLGIGDTGNRNTPQQVKLIHGRGGRLGARGWGGGDGDTSIYLVSEDGYTLYMWGYNGHGQSGIGQTLNPQKIAQVTRLM